MVLDTLLKTLVELAENGFGMFEGDQKEVNAFLHLDVAVLQQFDEELEEMGEEFIVVGTFIEIREDRKEHASTV